MSALKTIGIMLAGAAVLVSIDLNSNTPAVWLPMGAMVGLLIVELLTTRLELDQAHHDRMRALEKTNADRVDWLKSQSDRHGGVQ